jgi:hypothetical protein
MLQEQVSGVWQRTGHVAMVWLVHEESHMLSH